jgi:heat-inducible transcriptional repressor
MLDDRRSVVLQALVEEYIRTGQPVSSRSILASSGLEVSSATIRNDLAKLESYGFVHQPHTSAGRVPTPGGYRYYVDHCSPARLRLATRARIEGFFAEVHQELSKLLKETTSLLSDVSHYPSVVIGPGLGQETVHGVYLVHLASSVILAVIVGESGRVSREIVRLGFEPTSTELESAEALVEHLHRGKTIAEARADGGDLSAADASDRVLRLVAAISAALGKAEGSSSDIYVGGTSQLAALWEDLANVSTVLGLLEEEGAVRGMLGDDTTTGTMVRIGAELNVSDVDLAVVSTTYGAGEQGSGRVGVIGPMRMDYRRTIKIVEEVGDGLADSLGT